MKVISYVGAEGDCIVINSPRDIYPLLDWLQSEFIELSEKNTEKREEYEAVGDYLCDLMDKVEEDGYGSAEDIEYL